jgi:peptidoglycan/xylan/chitin deacetylase (PgdA/CDA1 family)
VNASVAVAACALAAAASVVPQHAAVGAVQPCSAGLVALTFDDGPSTDVTPKLLDLLTERHVPATFFVVGQRVASAKSVVLSAYNRGFVIGNHSYAHESLPSLSDDAIRSTLRRTDDALRSAGVTPSNLMRPPYGATSTRVNDVVKGMGLTSVLWDVDTRNWESGTASDITARTLAALRPGGRNIVLLHDGVARSSITLAAVPGIISGAQERGYCFALLGPSGQPVPPVPRVRVTDAHVKEADPGTGVPLVFTVALDRPTSHPVSLRVRTDPGTAQHDIDYRAVEQRVDFPVGTTTRDVVVWVRGDRVDEQQERLRLLLDAPDGLVLEDDAGSGTIFDNDPGPRVSLSDAEVTEPEAGSASVRVQVSMDRPSSRRVVVTLATQPVDADESDYVPFEREIVLAAGELRAVVDAEVLADALEEPAETFAVRVVSVVNARVADRVGIVTIAAGS